MEINFQEDKNNWDKFVATSHQRSIFVQTKFLDSLETDYHLVTCYDKGKIIIGTIILFEHGKPIITPHEFTHYQGILFSDNTAGRYYSKISYELVILEFFIRELVAKYKQLCFCHSWRIEDLRPFQWYNYHEPEKGIFKIDLRYTAILTTAKYENFNKYMGHIRSDRQKDYKRSRKLLEMAEIQDVEILTRLNTMTLARQGIERSQRQSHLIKSIAKNAILHNYGNVKGVFLNNEAVAAQLYLYDDRTIYFLILGSNFNYNLTSASAFLDMEIIKEGFEQGFEEIDFMGANSPTRGDFKISFNAELRPFFITTFHERATYR